MSDQRGSREHGDDGDIESIDDAAPDEAATDEAAADEVEERDPYKRRVAVVLALLGVLGGWIGILRIDAATNESFFARETTRAAVQSLRANVNESTVSGLGLDLDAERAAIGLASPFRDDGLAAAGGGDAAAAGNDLAEREAAITIGGQDREAIERSLTTEAARLDLTRSALAETRVTYNNRTSQYETVLTTLAVALFLVGFTLVLGPRTRPPILVPGLLLAAYVFGWAIWIHQRDIPTTDTDAIEQAAEGEMHTAFGEFDDAAERFTRAIDIDGDFVGAFTGRSIASFLAANPDFQTNLAIIDNDSPLVVQATEDADEAVRLGQDSDFPSLLVSGLYRFYGEDYDGAVERLEAAVDVNDTAPEAYLLLASARLAQGDDSGTTVALEEAFALLDLEQASNQTRQYVADNLSLIEFVEAAVPEQVDSVERVRANLASGESAVVFEREMSEEVPSDVSFALDEIVFEDGVLDTTLSYSGLPEDTPVTIYVYEQPAEGAPFAQTAELARFLTLSGDGSVQGAADVERTCQPVAFRYDIYVNGALVESIDAPGGAATC